MAGVLLRAVTGGRPRQVRQLLQSGLSTEHEDECAQTALIRAIFLDHPRHRERIVRLLLNYGASVGHCDVSRRSALSWACMYGRDKEVGLLLRHAEWDIDLNQRDQAGQTPLFHAATSGNAACVKRMVDVLTNYGLSVSEANNDTITPLMQAHKLRHDVCASILLHCGADPKELQDFPDEDWGKDSLANTLAKMERGEVERQTFFPILSPAVAQKIKHQELRAGRMYILGTHEDSDDDSTYGSEPGSARDDVVPLEIRHKPVVSASSHTSYVDSDSDEPDDFSTPVVQGHIVMSRDVGALYRLSEDQLSPGNRPTAARPRPAAARHRTDNPQQAAVQTTTQQTEETMLQRSGMRRRSMKKPPEFRQMVLQRQHRQAKLDAIPTTRFPTTPPDDITSNSDDNFNMYFGGQNALSPAMGLFATEGNGSSGTVCNNLNMSMAKTKIWLPKLSSP